METSGKAGTYNNSFLYQMWRPFQIVELKFFDPMISDDYLKLRNEVYMKINNQLINKKGRPTELPFL